MSKTVNSPLRQAQTDGDELKVEVDTVEKTAKQLIENKHDGDEIQGCYQKCIALKLRSSELLIEAHGLLQQNEKSRIQNFQIRKNEEIQRIQKLQSILNRLMDDLEKSSSSVEHLRSMRQGEGKSMTESPQNTPTKQHHTLEENDYEYSDEGDEYNDEDDEDESFYEVIDSFDAQEDDDLSVKPGEVVCVIHKQEDGWWKVRDDGDNIGMVPSNFLRPYEEELEEELEDEAEATLNEDTGELTAQNTSEQVTERKSGKELWKGVREAVNEPVKTDVTDVLAALGAIPAGFRPSTLYRFAEKAEYTMRNAVLPAFSDSNTGLSDLQWDPTLNQVRAIPTRVLRSCRLWSCKMIPLPGSGVEVLSRHVRLALFNGTKVLSNVHTVRATWAENSPKVWTFSPRVPGVLSSLLDGACTVRSDLTHNNLGILFELCVTYIRSPARKILHYNDGPEVKYGDSDEDTARAEICKTGERAELSCGWVFLKLYDEQGIAIPNKTYELKLHGGTPFESGVAVDPTIARRASSSRLRNLLTANKQPKIIIKLGTPDNAGKKLLNLLPMNVVLPSSYCGAVAIYRRILADALIRDRLSPRDADPLSCPFLSTFPDALQLPDVMDAVRNAWADKTKTFRRGDKRDKESLKMNFKKVFLETGYVLVRSMSLPPYQWAHLQTEQGRWQKIYQHIQLSKSATSTASGVKTDSTNAVLKSLLSSNVDHMPFDMNELSCDLVKDHKVSIVE